MLSQLSIKNYATVDALEIDFQAGMSVITGETGAGKSIMLGALGLTLGDRADKTIVRPGTNKAEICAEFDISQIPTANTWLEENDLLEESEGDDAQFCILRRLVGIDGRSKAYINGSPVTLSNLKTLGEMLLDIHSQHEHQSLLNRATHQRLLDDYGVKPKLIAELESTWRQWHKNFQTIEKLSNQSDEDSAQFQLLSFQLTELDEMDIADNEATTLEGEFKSLNHADETIGAVRQSLNLSSEDENSNASSLLHQSLATLQELPEKDGRITNIIKLLETATIQLDEAVADLRSFTDEFEANPERLEQVNARLSLLHGIARKHKVKPVELGELISDLRSQLSMLENSEEELGKLQANDQMLRSQYQQLAKEVSSQRSKASKTLAKKVNEQLKKLGMPHAQLEISLHKNSDGSGGNEKDRLSISGLESIEFLVSTNPDQPAKPLIKIASGGELSRISLAIQVITAQTSHTPSLVFDEVDVGIGGGVAKVVGELLRQLAESTQILCVTHQAQVAGQGHHHFFVSKSTEKKSTLTRITELETDEIVKEVARMLGGEEFSAESLAHAQQMVANS
ncbi:MAG: DNA repair protein RecN [Gammaproteobacteria bacterium]|jgi:DNA repair protein RecN (Recombination protein N)|nr:DNA repair protein RecN [Gammaproteobacteria bacterium]MBT3858196.1 DNA repair protein RecN [Gammaproteobacteria bacterium]MBT3988031.1 DNA repair protein RecN [Gammaproteobacteria bacterium]MBT4582131.1 DNA repair protein RecN [Gammaproteobacteria bacterium]MBT4660148.1 DNA repair protein RecN [Gammaproteobacteria bacterium]